MKYCKIVKILFSSLIHDSILIKAILHHLINIEELGVYAREKTVVKCDGLKWDGVGISVVFL